MHVQGLAAEPSTVIVSAGRMALLGELSVPPDASAIIVFAHSSGSGRRSPPNRAVARSLASDGFATLMFDLLTPDEESAERYTRHLRFDIPLLASRLTGVVEWVSHRHRLAALPIGVFADTTAAAAAMITATRIGVRAMVARSGRLDLARDALPRVRCPTLLIVGDADPELLELNRCALPIIAPAALHIVPGADELFEDPAALAEAIAVASRWFRDHLATPQLQRVQYKH